jgi:thiamine-phosphate pyrophosphorylase
MKTKLQYISQGSTIAEQLKNIQEVLENGCEWIQLRFKNQTDTSCLELSKKVQFLCKEHKAILIINDNVSLAQEIDADGVHLGLLDMRIKDARIILGEKKIIGGTANTFEDIQNHIENGCDYVGLGPFRFTTTKENLSPILGLEGYQSITQKMKTYQLNIPVYAIGGITLSDIEELMKIGIQGVALSGIISRNTSKKEIITQINEKLYGTVIV